MRQLLAEDLQKAAGVAVINKGSSRSLNALTAAALCLPGLIQAPAQAAEEEVSFGYGHYQEGQRNLYGAKSNFNPIEVDSLLGSGQFFLTDRIKFAFNYTQDTWGGATPIASAPLAFGGNGGYTGSNSKTDSKSGATPILNNPTVLFDKQLNPVISDGQTYKVNNQIVDTMALASAEIRQQGDFNIVHSWDDAALEIGGGTSVERDYDSSFGNINGSWDINGGLTTLNMGQSYTNSYTHATVNHDSSPYVIMDKTYDPINQSENTWLGNPTLITGTREDWATSLGVTQIINKNTLLNMGAGYTRSTGYMANPYKAVTVAFIDPAAQNTDSCPEADLGLICAQTNSLLEQRPDQRNQFNGTLRYVQHVDMADAATHVGYRFFKDDWGITSHTLDADWVQPLGRGWLITPKVRYYSQDQANFYTPYLITNQAQSTNVVDTNGNEVMVDENNPTAQYTYDPNTGTYFDAQGTDVSDLYNNGDLSLTNKTKSFDRSKLPTHYSSDYRLAGFGTLSGGISLSKLFAKGIALDIGYEYYTHQSALRLGGGQGNSFNNMDYWMLNAGMKIDLGALSPHGGSHQNQHHHDHGVHAPAGVLYDHMLPNAGDMMVGYRFMYGSQSGDMLNGTHHVNNQAVVNGGCGANPCFLQPSSISMDMHMLELMYAPTDWLTLMLMPQFVDMTMKMERLRGPEFDSLANNNAGNPIDPATGDPTDISSHITHHVQNEMQAGGLSDVGMYALFKLFDNGTHHVHITAGLSAPVGNVDVHLSRNHQVDGGYADYGMQLGSGTWDLRPSMTYTGHINEWSWGAQTYGTIRMQNQNESGYALGDTLQATGWGSYSVTKWLSTSLRGIYTLQGGVDGQFNGLINQFSPTDYPTNYGGKYLDLGFGLSASVPSGILEGNRLSIEWLQPIQDNVNGYQLQRVGSLVATWGVDF